MQSPCLDAEQATELLFGELVEVVGRINDWSHVRLVRDGYRGWVTDVALSPEPATATLSSAYRINQPSGLVFTRADIKSPLLRRLYMGTPILAGNSDGNFHALDSGGFIHHRHLAPQSSVEVDPVTIAMRFLGTPYLWGGRTCDGIDCSALVQTALYACGIDCPRDTGDQRTTFAADVVAGARQRGDLVFFPGHVGIMVDAANLLHANAFWMTTVVEPLAAVVDRFGPAVTDPILAIARPV